MHAQFSTLSRSSLPPPSSDLLLLLLEICLVVVLVFLFVLLFFLPRKLDSCDFLFFFFGKRVWGYEDSAVNSVVASMQSLMMNPDSTSMGESFKGEEQARGTVASPASPAAGEGRSGSSSPGNGSSVREKVAAKVIPCPRCESMNTKFCYFNNYSVKQPRYFCRQCQRYWTMGGSLRNVPVGGGIRKKSRIRRSDPYLRSAATQGVVTAPLSSEALSSNSSPLLQNMGFQQLLMQDVNTTTPYHHMAGFELQQEHYLEHHDPSLFYPVMNKSTNPQEVSSMHPMYVSSRSSNLGILNANPLLTTANGSYFSTPNAEFAQGDTTDQVTEWGSSVPEHLRTQSIWNESKQQSGSPNGHHHTAHDEECNNISNSPHGKLHSKAEGGYEPCNMLLHLGMNNKSGPEGSVARNGASPPHGSSTIEEEGSTLTNGYSTNGYEDGDAVSSMWPDLEFFR